METMNTAQEERRRMLEEFRKRKEELRNTGQSLNKAPLSVANSVRRLPATVKKTFPRVPFTETPIQRTANKLPRTAISNRLVLQQNPSYSLAPATQAKDATNMSRFRTPANRPAARRATTFAANTVTSRLTRGTLSTSLKSQNPESNPIRSSPKTTRRSRLVHKKRSPMVKRNSPRINLSANRVTQVTVRRGPLNDVTLTSLRKPAQRVETSRCIMKTPRRALRYATIGTQTSPCMIVKLEPVNAAEPQEAPKQCDQATEDASGNVASIVHKFHLIQKQQLVESRKSAFAVPTPKILQVIDAQTKEILLEEFVPSRGISLFRLSKVVEYAATGEEEVTRAMFEILGAPPKSGTVHITYTADYWIERAKFEEQCGNIQVALGLLQKGKQMKAKPTKDVKVAINRFIGRHRELGEMVEFEPINIRFQMDGHASKESSVDCELASETLGRTGDSTVDGASNGFDSSDSQVKEQDPVFELPREVRCSPFVSDDDTMAPPVLESNVTFSEEESANEDEETTNMSETEDVPSKEVEDMTNMLDQVAISECCGDEASTSVSTPRKATRRGRSKASALDSVRRSARLLNADTPAGESTKKKLTGKRVSTVKKQLEEEVENEASQLVYTCITPSRKLRQSLDCNVVLTPVRRSARLARNADKLPPSLRQHTQTFTNLSELPEDMDFAWVPNDSVEVRKD
ncbi:hypothetical protein K493DRAFT_411499 [Basidiobolus meristosporus CBS 931.73]|uniref:Uncharacterized protein n=1 Tax=Basidiobolus meristosporus CBS 931.73 TaxID=1314790 RepID=A0A1Y1XHD4_9FUNG|nr:hypothetical protein K493DRAFT_411499 [Basidiobolus meristosporus CBS 931.73]|eukprot:ORX85147.1 hypothetical protein K493DRAFT_411499 [Basidiobolus meristosporus CBS 931.73]